MKNIDMRALQYLSQRESYTEKRRSPIHADRQQEAKASLNSPLINATCPCDGHCLRCLPIQTKSKATDSKDCCEQEANHNAQKVTSQTSLNQLAPYIDGVRLHHDAHAAQKAESLNAHAFTIGRDIYFNQGAYNPDTTKGKQLLVHELTHVQQQQNAGQACCQKSEKDEQTFKDNIELANQMIKEKWGNYLASDKMDADVLALSSYHKNEDDYTVAKEEYAKALKDKSVASKSSLSIDEPGHGDLILDVPEDGIFFGSEDEETEATTTIGDTTTTSSDTSSLTGYQEKTYQDKLDSLENAMAFYNQFNNSIHSTLVDMDILGHEIIHYYGSDEFSEAVGHSFNEGATQYLTEIVFAEFIPDIEDEHHINTPIYEAEVKLVKKAIKEGGLTKEKLIEAYFTGDTTLINDVTNAMTTAGVP